MNTKMLYHRDNFKTRMLKRKIITLVALVAVGAFALLVTPVRNTLTQMVYFVTPTMWGAGSTTRGAWDAFLINFKEKEALVNENATLRGEIESMQAQMLDRNLLAEKVVSLEGTLGRAASDNRVAADVIAGPGWAPYDTLIIDAGSDNGITSGDMVVYAGSGVIGEVIEVSTASSKMKLYSSPGVEHAAVVGPHAIPITAIGKGMGNYEAKVPQDGAVAVGDTIVSAKGSLILGTISSIEEKPAEPFKRIYFREPFNTTEIRSVEVIVDKRS